MTYLYLLCLLCVTPNLIRLKRAQAKMSLFQCWTHERTLESDEVFLMKLLYPVALLLFLSLSLFLSFQKEKRPSLSLSLLRVSLFFPSLVGLFVPHNHRRGDALRGKVKDYAIDCGSWLSWHWLLHCPLAWQLFQWLVALLSPLLSYSHTIILSYLSLLLTSMCLHGRVKLTQLTPQASSLHLESFVSRQLQHCNTATSNVSFYANFCTEKNKGWVNLRELRWFIERKKEERIKSNVQQRTGVERVAMSSGIIVWTNECYGCCLACVHL